MCGDRSGFGHRARADAGERAKRGGVSRLRARIRTFRTWAFRTRDGSVRERRRAACALRRLQGPVVVDRMAGLDAGQCGHPAPWREEFVLVGEGTHAASREQEDSRHREWPEEAAIESWNGTLASHRGGPHRRSAAKPFPAARRRFERAAVTIASGTPCRRRAPGGPPGGPDSGTTDGMYELTAPDRPLAWRRTESRRRGRCVAFSQSALTARPEIIEAHLSA